MAVELVKIVNEIDYLHCYFEGTFENLRLMEQNTDLISKASKEYDCLDFLLDFRKITGRISIVYQYYFGVHLCKVAPISSHIALLPPLYTKSTATSYLENVVANRGGCLKVFWNEREAVKWLKSFKEETEKELF